jgi:hypothetical protein
MTTPTAPVVTVWARLVQQAIELAYAEGIAWWAPGDEEQATVERVDEWTIGYVGGRELLRVRTAKLEEMAENERLARN